MPSEIRQVFSSTANSIESMAYTDDPVFIPPLNEWTGGIKALVIRCVDGIYTTVDELQLPPAPSVVKEEDKTVVTWNASRLKLRAVIPGMPYVRRFAADEGFGSEPFKLRVAHINLQ